MRGGCEGRGCGEDGMGECERRREGYIEGEDVRGGEKGGRGGCERRREGWKGRM